ncbi:hypothetical protein [Bradyrhizobium cenepequi]
MEEGGKPERLRWRLGELLRPPAVEGTKKARICNSGAVSMCGRLRVRGEGIRRGPCEGDVQKSKILKYHAWDLKRPCAAFGLDARKSPTPGWLKLYPSCRPRENGLTVNSPPLDTVGEQLSTGENIGGDRRLHPGFIAIGGHDQPTEPDGKIGQARRGCRSCFSHIAYLDGSIVRRVR